MITFFILSALSALFIFISASFLADTGKVIDYIREYGCTKVIIGLPLNLDDTDSVQTEKVRAFRTMLENKLKSSGPLSKVTVEWQDERYSTAEAEEVLIEANMSREDRKKITDRQAAIVILQRYLDRMPREDSI